MNPDLPPPPLSAGPPVLGPAPSTLPPPPSRAAWRSWVFLGVVGFYPLLIGILGSYVQGAAPSSGPALPRDVRGLILTCLESFGMFALLFAAGWFFGRPRREELFLAPIRWWDALWGFLWSVGLRIGAAVSLVLFGVVATAWRMLQKGAAAGDGAKEFQKAMEGARPKVEALVDFPALEDPLYVLVACTLLSFVTAGLREELWRAGFLASFQGILPKDWLRRFGERPAEDPFRAAMRRLALHGPAILLASVVFGLGHLIQGPGAVLLTGTVGLVVGAAMVLHRSLWTAVLAHGFFDATSLFFLALVYRYRDQLKAISPEIGRQLGF